MPQGTVKEFDRRNHNGVDNQPSSQPIGAGARYGRNHDTTCAVWFVQAVGSASSIVAIAMVTYAR